MPLPIGAFAAGAALAAGGIIRGAQVGALDEGPEYIRDGNPASPIDAVGLFAARQACKAYANNPDGMNDRPAAAYEKVCRPFLDNIGYGDGPTLKPPFSGGQCVGVNYFGEASFTNSQGAISTGGWLVRGPVKGLFVTTIADGFQQIEVRGTQPDGSPAIQVIGAVPPEVTPNPSFVIQGIQGGQPDNCGDPPPDYTEPVPPDEPETGPRPFVFAPDFNFDVDVDVDIDGRITIDIGTGPIVVDPFPDGEDGGPGDGGGDGPPSPPAPEPGPERPGGNGGLGGDDEFGEPPAGRRWVGCCIRLTGSPLKQPPIPNTRPEDVFPQVLGNIRLVCNAAGNRLTDTPVRIYARKVCVWEPVAKLNPTAVNVDLLPGFGYRFTPYSVPLED